ncbi:MAG TPA: hypothetical protein VFW10_10620 [Steroidobacteraceae bacterium]|nr:hypothetical protein [Steroidobacteraceae bacterium]
MHKFFGPLCAAFVLAISAPHASADSLTDGTYNFTVGSDAPAPTGSFVWDNTTHMWQSWTFRWDGAVYNLASPGTSSRFPLTDAFTSGGWFAEGPDFINPNCGDSCFPGDFSIDIGFLELSVDPSGGAFLDPNAFASGNYTVTEKTVTTAAPELDPSSTYAALTLLLGGLAILRGRRARLPAA